MTEPKLAIKTPNGRYYYRPGTPDQVPSISNIKKVRNVPAINGWRVNTAAKYAADNLDMLAPLPTYERYQLVKSAPYQPSESGKLGDVVHDWIDRYIKGENIPDEEMNAESVTARNMLKSFHAARVYYELRLNASEFTVWSDKYGYAGTADLDASIGNTRILIDHKTGKDVYWDTGMQLAALAKADFILEDDGSERPLPVFDTYAILHIRPMSFELVPVHHIDECFTAFLGLKAVFDMQIDYADTVLGNTPQIKTSTVNMEGE